MTGGAVVAWFFGGVFTAAVRHGLGLLLRSKGGGE